jgi:hypothetical protein
MFHYMFKGRIQTNKNRRRAGELETLLDEPFLAFLFNYLPSPPSSPAVGAMSVFLLMKKVQLFKVPFRGTLLRRENLKIHTFNSHGD